MVDISTALSSISTALAIAKTLNDINQDFDRSEYKLQIAELRSSLADAKIALSDVQEELAAKERKIAELQANFEIRSTLVERSGFRFFANDEGNPHGWAVCPRCEVVDGRIIRVVRAQSDRGHATECPACKQRYDGRETMAF